MSKKSYASRLSSPAAERDHALGPADAPVTLVEYGDYECPFCGQAHPVVQAIINQCGDQLRFIYRHFPLATMHPHAERAAEAAEAAGAQGKFWPMHDMLFEYQQNLEDPALVAYADAIGLDLSRFTDELARRVFAPRVREDFLSGAYAGVNGTPTFFINGERYDGPADLEMMLEAIENALEARAGLI